MLVVEVFVSLRWWLQQLFISFYIIRLVSKFLMEFSYRLLYIFTHKQEKNTHAANLLCLVRIGHRRK